MGARLRRRSSGRGRYRLCPLTPVVALAAVLLLSACGMNMDPAQGTPSARISSVPVEGGAYVDVTAGALAQQLQNKDFPLINVHVPYAGEIAGTDAFIPYDQIAQNLDKLPADKSAKIVLYCRSGRMSEAAAKTLIKLGYTNVWSLNGGMDRWQQQGFELLNSAP